MEIKIIKEEKDIVEVELVGESHTLANVLKEECYQDSKVVGAAYLVAHPLTSNPMLMVRTKGKDAKKALKEAAERLEEKATAFEEKFKKE